MRKRRPPCESEGRRRAMLGWRRGAARQRPVRPLTKGTTHCSSSRPRRPHSPQTGCSGWSSRCRCRPGSGIRPRRRLSLEQRPPGTIRPGSPRGGQSTWPKAHRRVPRIRPLGAWGPKLGKVKVGQRLEVLRPGRGVLLTVAEDLIGAIPAVVCPVAPQHVGHTAPIVALAESLLAAA